MEREKPRDSGRLKHILLAILLKIEHSHFKAHKSDEVRKRVYQNFFLIHPLEFI